MKLFLCGLVLMLTGCNTFRCNNQGLTGCDHYSGWSDQVRALSAHSWKYAQLSSNVYDEEDRFEVSDNFLKVKDFENRDIDFFASLYKDKHNSEHVLILRGTDSPKDFYTGNNPFVQKQNAYALVVFDKVKSVDGINIATVAGHSLGGGMSIHISLNREGVKAYSFNGSPVFHIEEKLKENTRFSIVEHGEILKITRIFGQEATQLYTSIGCSSGNAIHEHSIVLLATCLTQIAATESPSADTSLTKNGIERQYKPR